MASSAPLPPGGGKEPPVLPRWERLLFTGVTLALCLLMVEAFSRVYWATRDQRVSFFDREPVLHVYYPQLKKGGFKRPIRRDADKFDVLVLGASVFMDNWTGVCPALKEAAEKHPDWKLRAHNVSRAGHSTLDSFHKYRLLGRHEFDLVMVYHAINELRFNNCEKRYFRDDYSHVDYYAEVNFAMKWHPMSRFLTFPDSIRTLCLSLGSRIGIRHSIPQIAQSEDQQAYGKDLKTPKAFEANLRALLGLARERGDPVLLMTYAYYVPEGYTGDACVAGELDYSHDRKCTPIEVWGRPKNIVAGLEEHNAVIRRLAEEMKPAYFIDMERTIPKEGRYFDDICHFSDEGSRLFVKTILDEAGPKGEAELHSAIPR